MACRWRNTPKEMLRAAPSVAFANTRSRSSANSEVLRRNAAYATSKATGTTSTADKSPGLGVMVSTKVLSSKGTPTLASLAPTIKDSASITRHL